MVDLDWENLGFKYRKAAGHIRYTWKDGKWDDGYASNEDTFNVSVAAGVFHYGQACFEGLKAFRNAAGEISVFRPQANAARLNQSLKYLLCPEIPEALFLKALTDVVKLNADYVPPAESKGALYIRPVVFASSPQIGVAPAEEYTFIMLVTPVGDYYKNGLQSVDAVILDGYDRAAPHGTGHIKAAGNYAASYYADRVAKEMGFPIALFLDPAEHQYIDEFSTSNFIGITADNRFVTPLSSSVLPSITNDSLQKLAEVAGMTVEKRQVPETELTDFTEVAACGTAVVITPVRKIVHGDKTYTYGEGCGPKLKNLYDALRALQYGTAPDIFDWMYPIK